jgi:deazaflavin-dependent oxidoreductase (nitroreductase family)
MRLRHAAVDMGMKLANLVHRTILAATGGRALRRIYGMPIVELRTTGRNSGRPYSTLLAAPICSDERVVLVASKGGDDRHPDWYRNLVANPDVELVVDGARRPVVARTASPAERADLWPRIVSVYQGYGEYQRRADREIPVVICEQRPAGAVPPPT